MDEGQQWVGQALKTQDMVSKPHASAPGDSSGSYPETRCPPPFQPLRSRWTPKRRDGSAAFWLDLMV